MLVGNLGFMLVTLVNLHSIVMVKLTLTSDHKRVSYSRLDRPKNSASIFLGHTARLDACIDKCLFQEIEDPRDPLVTIAGPFIHVIWQKLAEFFLDVFDYVGCFMVRQSWTTTSLSPRAVVSNRDMVNNLVEPLPRYRHIPPQCFSTQSQLWLHPSLV